MKQKLLNSIRLRIALLVALLCSLGTGSVWGQSDKSAVYTSNVTLPTSGTSVSSCNVSIGGNTYSATKLGKNGSGASATITAPSGTKYIHIHIAAWKGKSTTLTVQNGSTTLLNEESLTADNGITGSSTTFTLSTPANATTNYYKVITLSTALTSSATITITANSERAVFWGVNTEEAAAVVTSLSVKTAPTKTEYRVGEKIDFTGLVLNATVGGEATDVTSGYTAKIGETSVTSGTTVLSEVGKKTVTFTYGGQTATQDIYVGELKGIAITTAPSKVAYDEGQSFNSAGMVVTATYTDNETTEHTWTQAVALSDGESDGYTYSPTSALTTSNTTITVSYTWNEVEKTANQTISVTAGVPYTVTFDAGSGSCATESLDEASFGAGVTLPTPTIGVTGWSFAGWATASTTNTEDEPTLYAADATYNPTENTTLYAVYKFTEAVSGKYMQTSSLSDVTSASTIVLVHQNGKAINGSLATNVTFSADSKGWITPTDAAIYSLSGDNTDGFTLTNSTKKLGGASKSNATMASDASNSLWTFSVSGYSTGYFRVDNKSISGQSLEFYNSAWKVYTSGDGSEFAFKVYIPAVATVYNSNPAAIINPTIAWTTSGDKTLYVQNTNTYTNAANVTGISKSATYTSSDETVATVTSAGVVTALKAGETTITAKVAKEVGVNTEASVTYDVTVKDASNIAGLKEVATSSSATDFTADLTDAVVTYVNGSYAYIEDASGAIYASCGSSLTAGKKINGEVSGSVKVSYQIDEITAVDISGATVEDGVIPSAIVQTTAQVVANKATLEGKLVSVTGAKVTASLTSGKASGGKIKTGTDDEINLYAPASNIDALKDAEGTFNGYISLYNGGLRFNIYEQSQISLTKNAPTAQTLTFESDAVELDEETSAYSAFTGQAVSGAQGTVTYSVDSDEDGVVTSINGSNGAVVLSGNYGTATIKATAAAANVTEAGVTTPYTETEKTYTVTVYPRYTVTFSANGVETALRQATHGATIDVPEDPSDISGFKFMGWKTSTVSLTDEAPTMADLSSGTVTPENNTTTYYAVYAYPTVTPGVEYTSTFTIKQASAPSSPYVNNGSSWTWSGLTFENTASACINSSTGAITFTMPASGKAKSLDITKTSNAWAGAAAVVLKDASNNTVNTFTGSSLEFNFTEGTYDESASYTLTNSTGKNAWVDHITFKYTADGITYKKYCTTISIIPVTVSSAGYATFASELPLDFTDASIKAYIAEANGTTGVTFTQVEKVPANTGILLYKADGTTENIPVLDGDADDVTGNVFKVGTGAALPSVDGTKHNYILNNHSIYGLGFFKAAGKKVATNRAYIQIDESAGVKEFIALPNFGDETSITETSESIHNSECIMLNEAGAVFDLSGRRVNKAQKGLYILNGRKVLVK